MIPFQVKGHKVAYSASCYENYASGTYHEWICPATNFKEYSFLIGATNAYGSSSLYDVYRNRGWSTTPGFSRYVDNVYSTGLKSTTVEWYGNANSAVAKYKIVALSGYKRTGGSCTATGVNGQDYSQNGDDGHFYSCTITSLRPGTYYNFQVLVQPVGGTMTSVDNGCWDCYYSYNTYQRPGDVIGIRARSNHDGSVDVWYNQAKGANGSWHYAFAYTEDGQYVGQCSMGYTYDSSSCTIWGLTQGVRYKFYVASYNDATDNGYIDPKKSLSVRRIA